jgi:hypothetical protein
MKFHLKYRFGVRRMGAAWLVYDKRNAVAVATCVSRTQARKQAQELNQIEAREQEHAAA